MLYDGASSLFGLFQALLASRRSQMVFSSVDGNRSAKKPSYPHWVIIKFPYLQEEIRLASDTKTSIRTREIGRMGKAAVSGGLGRELLVASMQLLKSLNSAWRLHKRLYQVLKLISFLSRNESGVEGEEEEAGERRALWPNGKVHVSLWTLYLSFRKWKHGPGKTNTTELTWEKPKVEIGKTKKEL